jgi:glycolate oxidase iron-sulfur subunit
MNEADSPRGRIALCQALANDVSLAQPALLQHLDGCLQCRSCEKVCPSTVAYQRIYTETYQWLTQQTDKTYTSWLADWVRHPTLLQFVFGALWLYQRSGMAWLLRASGLLKALRLAQAERYLPKLYARALPDLCPATAPRRGTLAIFTGCLGRHLEQDAILALTHIAARAGYEVHLLPTQVCCGALHHNRGDVATSLQLARANIHTFAKLDADAVVFLTTGCGAHLRDYAALPWPDAAETHRAVEFVNKLQESCAWVHEHVDLPLANPGVTDVTVHLPCSHRNVLGHTEVVTQLLQRIPNLKLHVLDSKTGCCGGAGDYPLREPTLAAQVRLPVLNNLLTSSAQHVVTTNLGCALSLRAGSRDRSQHISVMHPLSLYAQALSGK